MDNTENVKVEETEVKIETVTNEVEQNTEEVAEEIKQEKNVVADKIVAETSTENDVVEKEDSEIESKTENQESEKEDSETEPKKEENKLLEDVDYTAFTKEELIIKIEELINEYHVSDIKEHIDRIKSSFYKIHNEQADEIKAKFIEAGGEEKEFILEPDELELKLKESFDKYKTLKVENFRRIEVERKENLKIRYEIISEIKELVNKEESLGKTFATLKELQEKWKSIGQVPQPDFKKMWDDYHFATEIFYDYVKINNALRDEDFKKNLKLKTELCEKAEELSKHNNVVEAFKILQDYHQKWREAGPIEQELRNEIWDRFKQASIIVNKNHADYFTDLKMVQDHNLNQKIALSVQAEELANREILNHKEWTKYSDEIKKLQEDWKQVGNVSKKENDAIYKRFRAACNLFFDNKKEFYGEHKQEQDKNLEKKVALCEKVEAITESTDWKDTTIAIINFQKQWKDTGTVSQRDSQKIWKRFRAACDQFFDNKDKHFKGQSAEQEENLKIKQDLLIKIKEFKATDDSKADLEILKGFQTEWNEIGFVPFKSKRELQNEFSETINNFYDSLKIERSKTDLIKYKLRIDNIVNNANAKDNIKDETYKLGKKVTSLESEISQLENNIGFFSNSKNSESLVKGIEVKIEKAKQNLKSLKTKLNYIRSI